MYNLIKIWLLSYVFTFVQFLPTLILHKKLNFNIDGYFIGALKKIRIPNTRFHLGIIPMSGCIKFTDEYSTQPKFNRIVISALFLLSGFFVPLLLMGYADMFGKIGIIYACILKICTSFFTSFAIPNEFSKMFIDPSDIIGSVARLYLLSACISIFPVGGSSAQEILFTLIEGRFKSRIFTRNRMCGIFFMLGIPFFTVYFSILCCLLILS